MKKNINLVLLGVLLMTLGACKKNEKDLVYKDVPRIMLEGSAADKATRDSTVFTFSIFPATTTEYNLTLVAKIAGNLSTEDRTFKVEVDPANTTANTAEYSLPSSFVVKAGQYFANIPIKVKKTARLDNISVKLGLKLASNENFELSERSKFKFVWTNDVTKPTSWESTHVYYLGKYSKVKHRLIIASQEFKDLNLLDYNISGNSVFGAVIYIQAEASKALNAYNAAHPGSPLQSETGGAIGLCPTCN